jgi:hypothetical protein
MCRWLLPALAALAAAPTAASAGVIAGYDPASAASHSRYDLYTTGFPFPSAVRNPSPAFIAAGLDLSGVGWVANNSVQAVTMISPQHFIMAAHFPPTVNTVNFVSTANVLHSYTIQSLTPLTTVSFNGAGVNQTSDVLLGRLSAPIPAADGVGFFPIAYDPTLNYQAGPIPSTNSFTLRQLLCAGFNGAYTNPANGFTSPHVGTNNVTRGPLLSQDGTTVVFSYDYDPALPGEFHSIDGDSGGPSFAVMNGRLALLGDHYDLLADNTSIDAFLPYYVSQLNALMAPDGFAVSLAPVPEPPTWLLVGLATAVGGQCRAWRRRAGAVGP